MERIIYNNKCPDIMDTLILMSLSKQFPYGEWPKHGIVPLMVFKWNDEVELVMFGRRIADGASYTIQKTG